MSVPIADMLADWLVDTFIYTGLLIALVLLLRRPVSRHFGPQVAYALWALPLLRFAMPPLVLPAWMAPAPEPAAIAPAGEPLMILVADTQPASAAPLMASPPQTGIAPVDLLLPLWLGGAALFLLWRVRSYFAMRRDLLAEARPVGEAGDVRLVETPTVASPLAFGVFDKVVALPSRFMAHPDRDARDLAIAHELAHHRGHDLLANIAAQPLLALHWFNPLAWAGWRAMRRDQEAACDARVVAGRGRTTRALYASVIAGFAGGNTRLALAAPMACPVLGEKSIIHRLRSLASSEVPTLRRRTGLAVVGMAALGLPLTASISYAQPSPPQPPAAPEAPLAPEAPTPPAALRTPAPLERIDPDAGHREVEHEHVHRHVHTIVRRLAPDAPDVDEERIERHIEHRIERIERDFGEDFEARMEQHFEAMAEAFAAREHALAEAVRAGDEARAQARIALRAVPEVIKRIDCGGDEPVIEREFEDGRRAIVICSDAIDARATHGLREARRAIANDGSIHDNQREQMLRRLDEHIERMSARRVTVSLRLEGGAAPLAAPAISAPAIARATDPAPPGTCSAGRIA